MHSYYYEQKDDSNRKRLFRKRADDDALQNVLAVREALEDWKSAVNCFEAASDPELVEFAVYHMEAARRRYLFLLRRVKAVDRSEN